MLTSGHEVVIAAVKVVVILVLAVHILGGLTVTQVHYNVKGRNIMLYTAMYKKYHKEVNKVSQNYTKNNNSS